MCFVESATTQKPSRSAVIDGLFSKALGLVHLGIPAARACRDIGLSINTYNKRMQKLEKPADEATGQESNDADSTP